MLRRCGQNVPKRELPLEKNCAHRGGEEKRTREKGRKKAEEKKDRREGEKTRKRGAEKKRRREGEKIKAGKEKKKRGQEEEKMSEKSERKGRSGAIGQKKGRKQERKKERKRKQGRKEGVNVTLFSWHLIGRTMRYNQQAASGPPSLLSGRLRQESGGLLGLVLFLVSFTATTLQAPMGSSGA